MRIFPLASCRLNFFPAPAKNTTGKILIDDKLGIATDYLDLERKVKAPTLKKNVLSRKMNLESIGGGAADPLCGHDQGKGKAVHHSRRPVSGPPCGKMGRDLRKAGAAVYILKRCRFLSGLAFNGLGKCQGLSFRHLYPSGGASEGGGQEPGLEGGDVPGSLSGSREEGEPCPPEVLEQLCRPYPHEADIGLHAKMSVSELKEQGQFVDDGESDFLPTVPAFLRKGEEEEREQGRISRPGGAVRGTAYHRALELLSFKDAVSFGDLKAQLDAIKAQGLMAEEALRLVQPGVLWRFFQTPLAERMRRADEEGRLYKEQQFVVGIPAREMDEADSDELVLIQGIIDAWFEDEDGAVLVDYRTDRIGEGEEAVLLDRYRLQLIYYRRALEQITGKTVRQAFLYSLALQKEIPVF